MTNMPDETVLAKIMTALDLTFEGTLHYHDEGYDSDNNDYDLPGLFYEVCTHLCGFSDWGLPQPCGI